MAQKPYTRENPPQYDKIRQFAEYKLFIDWFCTPQEKREFKTQGELAKHLGVHFTTLSNWKLMPEFRKDVLGLIAEKLGVEAPEIIASWGSRLKRESTAADIKLLLQYALDWKENTKVTVESDDIKSLTEAIAELAKK